MLNQAAVDSWLEQFLARLRQAFGDRLIFVAHHGSWARGEATPGSDIDVFVILDCIEETDLKTYRRLIHSMPHAQAVASSFLGSLSELKAWPRYEQLQCWYGCKVLHGTLEGLIEHPKDSDLIEDIRVKASTNLHHARHYMLHPHDLKVVVNKLYYPFKECFYGVQSWILLTTGKYYARKDELLAVLSDGDDKEIIHVAKDWRKLADDRAARPMYYIQLLERWCRKMMARITDLTPTE